MGTRPGSLTDATGSGRRVIGGEDHELAAVSRPVVDEAHQPAVVLRSIRVREAP